MVLSNFNGQAEVAENGAYSTQPPYAISQKDLDASGASWLVTYPVNSVHIPATRRILITNQIGGITLPRQAIVGSADPDRSKLVLWIRDRSASSTGWTTIYPCWEIDHTNGNLVFLFDKNLFTKRFGRYEAALVYANVYSGSFELDYRPYSPIRAFGANALPYKLPHVPVNPFKRGEDRVYAAIKNFSSTLTKTLEIGETVLSLPAADEAILKSSVAPLGVEFMITDNIRSELVQYRGPDNGFIVVQRDSAKTGTHRFAAGSKVLFVWTERNISTAQQLYTRIGV